MWRITFRQVSMQDRVSVRHGIRFVLLGTALYAAMALLPESVLLPLCRHTAAMAARLLALFGMAPGVAATVVTRAGFSVDIVPECTSLGPSILFSAFVLTAPVSVRRRAEGLLAGLPLLHLLNLLRIVAVFSVGLLWPGLFDTVHIYLGQVFMILAVLALSLCWLRYADEQQHGVPFLLRALFRTIPLFLVWLQFNGTYVRFDDVVVRGIFAFFGYRLIIPYEHTLYYQTFNLVTFAALVLASRHSPLPARLITLTIGSLVLMAGHLIMRVCNVLLTGFGMTAALQTANVAAAIGQYLLPVLLWLLLHGWNKPLAAPAADGLPYRPLSPWWR
jgi:exosortase H (IPTLxxWG-CTERM-specific)